MSDVIESSEPPVVRADRPLWARALWTALPVLAVLIGPRLFDLLLRIGFVLAEGDMDWVTTVFGRLFPLGLMPFVWGAILVEVAAFVVPPWRRLRVAPGGRRTLGRAAAALGIVIALLQGFGVGSAGEALLDIMLGLPSPWMTALTLAAGSAIVLLLAEAVTTRGLASGVGVLITVLPVPAVLRAYRDRAELLTSVGVLVYLASIAAVAAATWFVLERRPRAAGIPLPASGVAPLLPSFLGALALVGPSWAVLSPASTGDPVVGPAPMIPSVAAALARLGWSAPSYALSDAVTATTSSLVIVLVLGALGAWLASRGSGAGAAAQRRAIVETLLFLVVLLTVGSLQRKLTRLPLPVPEIALATALVLDVAAEWRARRAHPDLVAVWSEHRPLAIDVAREALDEATIPVHTRGERLRRLLWICGPFVPVDLMVSRPHAERAAQILERALSAPSERKERAPEASRSILVPAAMLLVVAGGLFGVTVALRPGPPGPRTTALEILLVDDDHEISFDAEEKLSPRTMAESAPLGPGRNAPRRFAFIRRAAHESPEDARARLLARIDARRVPEGARVVAGVLEQYDESLERMEPIGWRTYLVKGSPIVTTTDVVDAAVIPKTFVGSPAVRIQLGPDGAKRLAEVSAANLRRRVAVIVEGRVVFAPVIISRLAGGQLNIGVYGGDPLQQLADAQELTAGLLAR